MIEEKTNLLIFHYSIPIWNQVKQGKHSWTTSYESFQELVKTTYSYGLWENYIWLKECKSPSKVESVCKNQEKLSRDLHTHIN